MKKICCLFLSVLLIYLFSGCNDGGKVQYLTLNYKNNTYHSVYEWNMKSDDYEVVTVIDEGTRLNLRIYNDDEHNEFVYCEDVDTLYHNDNFEFPENKSENIKKLWFSFPRKNGEILECLDEKIIKEFSHIALEGDYTYEINFRDYLLVPDAIPIWVEYKNYPAMYCYVNIMQDRESHYWLQVSKYDYGLEEDIDRYYMLDSNSYLYKYILKKGIIQIHNLFEILSIIKYQTISASIFVS